jgi:two-component sensor histidine kinase
MAAVRLLSKSKGLANLLLRGLPLRWPFRGEFSLAVLLGVVTLAVLTPFLLLGTYGLWRYVTDARERELERVAAYTKSLARAVDRELWGHIDTVQVLSGARSLREGDIAAFEALARDAAVNARGHFVLFDRTLRQLANTAAPPDASLPRSASSEQIEFVLDTQRIVISDLFLESLSSKLMFAILLPVVVDGDARYVLAYVPHHNTIFEVVRQTYHPEGWSAAVVDGAGRIIARSRLHEEFFGKMARPDVIQRALGRSGTMEVIDLEDRPSIAAYNASDLSDWRVFVWVPKDVMAATAYRAVVVVVLLALATLAVSIGAGYFAGRVIREPTRRLVEAAGALADGRPVEVRPSAMREANLIAKALVAAARETAARERALRRSEKHTRFIMRELSHRSKNLLAVVQAVARQTARVSDNPVEFEARFTARLAALARSHDLLVNKSWEGVSVADLAAAHLGPFVEGEPGRLTIEGPRLVVNPQAAQDLGMALHELATNAAKHGALSTPSGRVKIRWQRVTGTNGTSLVRLLWIETGGPPSAPPARKGFGHVVLERLVPNSLSGTSQLDWRPGGLVWTLEMPESNVVQVAAA